MPDDVRRVVHMIRARFGAPSDDPDFSRMRAHLARIDAGESPESVFPGAPDPELTVLVCRGIIEDFDARKRLLRAKWN